MPVPQRFTLALLPFAALLGWPAEGAGPSAPTAAPKVDVFGYYYLHDEEAPKGFQDVEHLSLSTIDSKGEEIVDVPLHGSIRLKAQGKAPAVDFPLIAPTLKGKAFSFTTKEVGGVSYRFAGTFVKLGNFPEERPEDEVVLKGRLTKLQGGKAVAESEVGFRYTGGD
ncbi:MAG TPA: hypothetical protein VF173_36890 [Thermoanaerobaculia bacterium]|nr:hypothetical protein [Thermoanaerobaculia bacterium]